MSVNNVNQEQIQTREQYKKARTDAPLKAEAKQARVQKGEASAQKTKAEAADRGHKRIRIRLFPIWLRIVLLAVFVVVSVLAGAAVGYGVIGDGKPADVFKESTWTHIRDLVEKGK